MITNEGSLRYWLREHGLIARWHEFTRYGVWQGIRGEAGNVAESIENIFDWWPIMWRDRDFDYVFLLTLMEHKLRRMAKHIGDHDRHVGAQKTAHQIRVTAAVIHRLRTHEYSYGFGVPTTEAFLAIGTGKDLFRTPRTPEERNRIRRAIDHEHVMIKQDVEYLAKMLTKYLLTWWD